MATISPVDIRVKYGNLGKSAMVGDAERAMLTKIAVEKERFQRKDIPGNIFYIKGASDKWIPLFPFYNPTSASGTSIPLASAAEAENFDPTDSDTLTAWSDDPEVCYYDTSAGTFLCVTSGAAQVTVSSVTTTTITLAAGFAADPADTDFITTGGYTSGQSITDIVFVPEGVNWNNYTNEYDLELNGYSKCTIDYDKLSSEMKDFVDAIYTGSSTATAVAFSQKFDIVGR